MGIITWNENLSVKINSIDLQHKKLIDLINGFYDNINLTTDRERLLAIIKGLQEYTVFHFSTEEKYMKQFNYPDYDSHKEEHDKFVATVLDYEERYKSGRILVSVEITNIIKKWITHHIMEIDKKYSDFFLSKDVV